MNQASKILKSVANHRFIIAHPFDHMHERLSTVNKALNSLGAVDFLEILPKDYKDPNFLSTLKDKDKYTAVFALAFKRKELEYVLDNFPSIEWIQAIGTGVDAIISLPQIQNSPIVLTNLRSVSAELLAEFALLGSLYFAKRIPEYVDLAKQKIWKDNNINDIQSLSGKRALVVGLGTIGTNIALKCKVGFGMHVMAVKRDPGNIPVNHKGLVDQVFSLEHLAEAVKEADFVYAALPKIHEKPMIFGKEVFANMKKGAVFVNVGRGSYVDEQALIALLKNGHLAGAALDVFAQEPLPADSPFYTDPELQQKVLNTCHSIDHSSFLLEKTFQIITENVKRYWAGNELDNIVDKKLGY